MSKSIKEIIGDIILNVECVYGLAGEGDSLETCLTYLHLEKGGVINLPGYGSLDVLNVEPSEAAQPIMAVAREYVIGQPVADVLFLCDSDQKPYPDWVAFMRLGNGYVLHEFRMEPAGSGTANLWLFSPDEFVLEIEDRKLNLISFSKLPIQVAGQAGQAPSTK